MGAIIVLGGHRCGTSSVAGVIAHLGIPASLPGDQIEASPSNPRGHFEDATLCRLHERMLGAGGWRNPQLRETPPRELQVEYDKHLRRRAAAAARWCVKDPRLCLLLPYLIQRLRELEITHRIVGVDRAPESAAESLQQRQGLSLEAARRIAWLYEGARRAQLAWVRESTDVRVMQFGYRELLRDPAKGVRRLAAFLEVSATACAVDSLDPGLRHW